MTMKPFTFELILANVLFNLGFIYTDVISILLFFYRDAGQVFEPTWVDFGGYVGDLILRLIFSKYANTSIYVPNDPRADRRSQDTS
jgi:hypothetical protein